MRKQGCEERKKQEFDLEFHYITITSQEHYHQDLHLVKSIHNKRVDYKELTQCHNLVPFDSEAPQPSQEHREKLIHAICNKIVISFIQCNDIVILYLHQYLHHLQALEAD